MSDTGQELHPRLASAHSELHAAASYREAIRMVDAGHFAAAIPPTHRSAVKGFIEQGLTHFHDLGFQHGMAGLEGGLASGWSAMEQTEVADLRQRLESHLNRLSEEYRRTHRDVDDQWKQADMHDSRKQQTSKR